MTLPSCFHDPKGYFEECMSFFEEYQYLYKFPNTDILITGVLDQVQVDEDMDVFDENFNLSSDFLNGFFEKLQRFKPTYNAFEERLEEDIAVPLSIKKRHEIVYLAKEIADVCARCGCEIVVDFGSGLGYLDQIIFDRTNHKVLGLECNDSHYVNAKKRQRKYHENSIHNVKYIKHTIDENSDGKIKEYLENKFRLSTFCITGLHACADLTIVAINLFLKIADAKALVIMPCCYHKMCTEGAKFKNFPLSDCLRDICERNNSAEYLIVPFLRLATQPPHWNDKLKDLVFNLMARAVLQVYAVKNAYILKRKKRKAVKTKTLNNDFESYIKNVANGFKLTKREPSISCHGEDIVASNITFELEEVRKIWREIPPSTFKKAAIFILLQNNLQPVFENFILYDRLVYLKENGIKTCEFKRITNERISPRCLALIAYKNYK